MRQVTIVLVSLIIVALAGCQPRYQIFTLVKGTEAMSSQNSTAPKKAAPASPVAAAAKKSNTSETKITRRVLVDQQTGTLYYFEGLYGPLRSIPSK